MSKSLSFHTYARPLQIVSGLSLLSFNVMAEGYYDQTGCVKTPFIPFKQRFAWFKPAFKRYNASIVCLQEVDYAEEFLDYLETLGYLTFYNATSKITPKETRQGLLIAIKQSQFQMINQSVVYYDKESQQYQLLVVHLQDKGTKKEVMVFTTQLKSQKDQEEVRLEQIAVLHQYMETISKENPLAAIILCGDLNTEPTLQSYKKIKGWQFGAGDKLKSVYKEGEWTRHKVENEDYSTTQIDHILYMGLQLIAYERSPLINEVSKTGLPDKTNPSDHIPLYAIFKFQ